MVASSQRKIIHCDCDCFYVSVEVRDNPALRGLPVAVGGSADRRGVIATCSYEARQFGVHSAMATATAKRLCPDLILVSPDFDKYREASQQIRHIYSRYTELIEPLSLDEAYLDVTSSQQCRGSATLMAQEIRSSIRNEVGITASAGIAPNKFLAKVGSDWNKPDGQFVILPTEVASFVQQLPVTKIFGVGKVTAERLHKMGVTTCGDLQQLTLENLIARFGKFGPRLYELCRGIDSRSVKTERVRKSISVEHTFSSDLEGPNACLQVIPDLWQKLQSRSKQLELAGATPFLKMKFSDFTQTTIEQHGLPVSLASYQQLCRQALERKDLPVRLLGLGARLKPSLQSRQLSLFDN